MSLRQIIWLVLGISAIFELALIADIGNEILRIFDAKAAPSGPVDIQFHGQLYPILGSVVIVAVVTAVVAAAVTHFYSALIVTTVGSFVMGGLFASNMPDTQNPAWWAMPILVTLALAGSYGWERYGVYKRSPAPDTADAAVMATSRAAHDELK